MLERVRVIGRGRVGAALAARLEERDLVVSDDDPELVMLCVPDAAIADVARPGARRARGSRTSAARRRSRALDAAHAALRRAPAADVHARPRRRATRRRLGRGHRRERRVRSAAPSGSPICSACVRSRSRTRTAPLYHAGAAIASNYLVTLYRAAARLCESGRRAARSARAR